MIFFKFNLLYIEVINFIGFHLTFLYYNSLYSMDKENIVERLLVAEYVSS